MSSLTKVWRVTQGALVTLMLTAATQSQAADVVQLPPVNLGDTNFLDGMAGPGTLIQVFGSHSHGDSFRDGSGNALPGSNSIDAQAVVAHYAHISEHKIWGGYYGAEALLSLANIDPETTLPGLPQRGESGVGDLSVSPLLIQWSDSTLFGKPYFHRLNFVFVLPTGSYDADNDVNTGSNLFSFNPHYAGTLHLNEKWATSFRLHYLWNSKNDDPNPALGADDIQPGSAFHMNYAASYRATENLRLGVAGYYLKQLSDDQINGVSQVMSKEEVFAVGPGLQYKTKGGVFNLNSYFESGAENRPEGYRLVARYSWIFPK